MIRKHYAASILDFTDEITRETLPSLGPARSLPRATSSSSQAEGRGAEAQQSSLNGRGWAPLNEAFARIKAALHSSTLAARVLHAHLHQRRLPSLTWRIGRDGKGTIGELEPAFWEMVTLRETPAGSGRIAVRFNDPRAVVTFKHWYFVARRELDRLHPVGRPADDTEQPPRRKSETLPADDDEAAAPQRRKPGRKITMNWRLHVAAELHRIVEIKHKPPPPASYFAQFCGDNLDYEPDIRTVQKLLRSLLG